jgi:hypothetical protein
LPNPPLPFDPQQATLPPDRRTQPTLLPSETAVASETPETATGVGFGPEPEVPFPSCPPLLDPQHITVPETSLAHESSPPAAIAVAPVIPGTAMAASLLGTVNASAPSCPPLLDPQHATPLSDVIAHAWRSPMSTPIALEIPATIVGVASAPELTPPQQTTAPDVRIAHAE